MPKPVIDAKKCTGCFTCVGTCSMEVFAESGKKAKVVNADACVGCRACETQCEAGAITVED